MTRIEELTLHRLQVPLTVPYVLSLGEIRAFDTILVAARDSEGRTGLGEATIITGYTDETIDESWKLACRLAGEIAGKDFEAAKSAVARCYDSAPFTATALTTAVEMLEGHPLLGVEQPTRVPVLGLVHASEMRELETEVEALFSQGYRTLKVKVGFEVETDSQRVRRIQRVVGKRGQIRLDANQGYSKDEGCRFAAGLDPEGIELFEQPCAAGDWDGACAVAGVSQVPMMLDESIYGLADIARAAELKAAAYIKLKLMKMGGLTRLAEAINHIRACGMEAVLGNGVACEVGCWMEACVARSLITNAGEMNGFLKPTTRLLSAPLLFRDGAVIVEPGFAPALDQEAVASCTVSKEHFAPAA